MSNPRRGAIERPHYTQVPDEVFDYWLPRLSGTELKVFLYIVRRTFGFRKDQDAISLHQMSFGIVRDDGTQIDDGTGLDRESILRAIHELETVHRCIIVERRKKANGANLASVYRVRLTDDGPDPFDDDGGSHDIRPPTFVKGSESPATAALDSPEVATPPPGSPGGLLAGRRDPQQTGQTVKQQTEESPPPPENVDNSPSRDSPPRLRSLALTVAVKTRQAMPLAGARNPIADKLATFATARNIPLDVLPCLVDRAFTAPLSRATPRSPSDFWRELELQALVPVVARARTPGRADPIIPKSDCQTIGRSSERAIGGAL